MDFVYRIAEAAASIDAVAYGALVEPVTDWNGREVAVRYSRGASKVPYVEDWRRNVLGVEPGATGPGFLLKQVSGCRIPTIPARTAPRSMRSSMTPGLLASMWRPNGMPVSERARVQKRARSTIKWSSAAR
jgi:hypothetical protein